MYEFIVETYIFCFYNQFLKFFLYTFNNRFILNKLKKYLNVIEILLSKF